MVTLEPSTGPTAPMASAADQGLRPGPVWRWQPEGGPVVLATTGEVSTGGAWLELAFYPDLEHDSTRESSPGPQHGSTQIAIDLVCSGQGRPAVDQHGHPLDGSRRCLVGDQWNLIRIDLHGCDGPTEVVFTTVAGPGWLQVLAQTDLPAEPDDVVERVDTTRGTHSAFLYSRGNTVPSANLPQGFCFLIPFTNADDNHWPYGYHRDGARPVLQAVGISHWPSPWIGDRGVLQLWPWQGTPRPAAQAAHRFDHHDEQARPHRYTVTTDGGVSIELAPVDHGGIFAFTFDDDDSDRGVVIDTQQPSRIDTWQLPDGRAAFSIHLHPDRPPSGDYETLDPDSYFYGETLQPARIGRLAHDRSLLDTLLHRDQSDPAITLRTHQRTLEVAVAQSFISAEQARHTFDLELRDRSLAQVRDSAHHEWRTLLSRLQITGGRPDDRINAWSNLARLFSWPNRHHENVGTADSPHWQFRSPFTGEIADGTLMVNNGFWDTVRTCWPLYSLLSPASAPELLTGLINHYRDGGWVARWSGPGYIDIMPGTSSDAVFADAAQAGTFATLTDELDAFDSALKHASVPSPHPARGRQGIERARFVGFTGIESHHGLAWTMENATCDAALSVWAERLHDRALAGDPALHERVDEFAALRLWFGHRSLGHHQIFNPDLTCETPTGLSRGFYQGRSFTGQWRCPPADFDPMVWGEDYCETNAWGQRFHAQHDGAGLAEMMGGEAELARALDDLLAIEAVTWPSRWGQHSYNTQEMNEAQAHGHGQLAISNQPAHHIPFMYAFAGQPWKTQWLTRELLDTKFVGSEIGQGYPGDEDNGEMSGWWLCAALGLYPVFPGSGEWFLTTPLFADFSFVRDNGTTLRVSADHPEHRYTRPFSTSTEFGSWYPDLTRLATITGDPALIDDEGRQVVIWSAGESITFVWDQPQTVRLLTLTTDQLTEPAVSVEVCTGQRWRRVELDLRASRWTNQTQPHLVDEQPVSGVRVVATGPVRLRQLEIY